MLGWAWPHFAADSPSTSDTLVWPICPSEQHPGGGASMECEPLREVDQLPMLSWRGFSIGANVHPIRERLGRIAPRAWGDRVRQEGGDMDTDRSDDSLAVGSNDVS